LATFEITVRDIHPAMGKLGATMLRETIAGMRAAAARGQRHIITVAIPKAKPRPPVGVTGHYRAGWKTRTTPRGAVLYNDIPYAGIVELGRRPGKWPPVTPLRLWARRVLGLDEDEAKAAAFPIARAIKTRGIKGRHIVKNSLYKFREIASDELDRALARTEAKGPKA
jgi:hypothetical protein